MKPKWRQNSLGNIYKVYFYK